MTGSGFAIHRPRSIRRTALRFRREGQKKCKVLLRDLSRAVRSSSSSPTGC